MRNYIILNGNNSNEITGLLIQNLPPISKPLMRTAIEEIDGRDGDIVTNLGYSAYDKEVSIGLYGSYDVDEVIKYFSDNSKGQVTFSNEPDKYYNYEIINQIDFERLIRFKTAIVTLHCQPFKYPTDETPIEIAYQYVNNEAEEMDLDNTADAPMQLELKPNTQQDSTTGKNLLPINQVSSRTVSGVEITNLDDGTLKLNGTSTAGINIDYNYVLQMTANKEYNWINYNLFSSSNINISIRDSNSAALTYIPLNEQHKSYIPATNVSSAQIRIRIESGITFNNFIVKAMFIEGTNIDIPFEPYTNGPAPNPDFQMDIHVVSGDNTIKIQNRNCLNIDGTRTSEGLTNVTNNTVIKVTGTSTNNYSSLTFNISQNIPIGTYTFSIQDKLSTRIGFVAKFSDNTEVTYHILANQLSTTFTTTKQIISYRLYLETISGTTYDLTIKPQLEKGSTATDFVEHQEQTQLISLGNIEYCEIGDYKDKFFKNTIDSEDYDSTLELDKWYLKKNIGKVVLDGSESYNLAATYTNNSRFTATVSYLNLGKTTKLISDYFLEGVGGTDTTNIDTNASSGQLMITIPNSIATTANQLKTWLSTHNTEVYYVLETPEYILLNDTLQEQLDNLQRLLSYDDKTHITQNANDKPFMLNATAVQKGTDTATVDNDGNIYSKPTLDIEGSGTIGIYLNNNQMFSVDLSSSNECIIDVTNLEAYDPSTNELMNRQVTGDYSKFTLPVGENEVKVSGNVTKATISNYTRWL